MLVATLLRSRAPAATRCGALRNLTTVATAHPRRTSLQWPPRHRPARLASSTAPTRPASSSIYPELLNVYQAPTHQTVGIGMIRLVTIVFCVASSAYATLVLPSEPDTPAWVAPAYIVGSAAPLAFAMVSGPAVSSIRVRLPAHARKSQAELLRWASHVPPTTTRLQFEFIRFRPWVSKQEVRFSDLTRLPPTWTRLANVEHIPAANHEVMHKHRVAGWFARTFWGRYWVNMHAAGRDRSSVPGLGVWETMWRQIPYAADEATGTVTARHVQRHAERKPVVMQNRAPAAPRVPPPPAVAKARRAVKK